MRFVDYALASIGLLVVLTGCGADEPARTEVRQAVVTRSEPRPATAEATAAKLLQPEAEKKSNRAPASSASSVGQESWPPEMVVSVSDTLASPGEVVEILVLATPDVREMELWDGMGQKEPFYFDAGLKRWRATYRMPFQSPWERIGLSVTARNDGGRWRRVWVFVKPEESASNVIPNPEPAEIEANSTKSAPTSTQPNDRH